MDIMIVDDDRMIVDLVALVLSAEDRSIRAFDDPAVALAEIARLPPDLLVLDVRMPGLDGIALLRVLSQRRLAERTRILMLSAEEDLHYVLAARELKACGYLLKPFTPASLADKVAQLMEQPRLTWIDDFHCVVQAVA